MVVDASAGVEMLQRTASGLRLQARLPEDPSFWAPEHYFTEVGAVLRRLELHDHHPAVRIRQSLDVVLAQPIRRVSVRPLMPEAWALRHNLTLADALYVVVVARHLDAPLVTADQRLARSPGLPVTTITP